MATAKDTTSKTIVKLNALKKVAVFDGSADIERWLDRLEFAMKIDNIPKDQQAAVLFSNLDGPAYDVWKGMDDSDQEDTKKIKAALRSVFGLRKMDAWIKATAPMMLAPGDCVDAVFQELRRLLKTATAGFDPVNQIASCLLLQRLPPVVRDQVLLRCGKMLKPAEVLESAKQLLSTASSGDFHVPNHSAMAATKQVRPSNDDRGSSRCGGCGRTGHQQNRCRVRCFHCKRVGHIARLCTSEWTPQTQRSQPAVSGNEETGQPQECAVPKKML